MPRPLSKRFGLATKRNPSILSHVVHLIQSRGPARIARLVIASGVGPAVKLVFWRWFGAHIRKKILKLVPAFAKGDAAFAVIAIAAIRRILASISGAPPRTIFRSSPFSMLRGSQTAAGFRASTAQVGSCYNICVPAIAAASPVQVSGFAAFRRHPKNNKSPKAFCGDIYFGRHNGSRKTVLFSERRPHQRMAFAL